jgi:hypothetical protein
MYILSGSNPVCVNDVVDTSPTRVAVPETIGSRNTQYVTAPVTGVQFKVILFRVEVPVKLVTKGGEVVAELYEERALSSMLL